MCAKALAMTAMESRGQSYKQLTILFAIELKSEGPWLKNCDCGVSKSEKAKLASVFWGCHRRASRQMLDIGLSFNT